MQKFKVSDSFYCNAVIDIIVAVLLCMPQITIKIHNKELITITLLPYYWLEMFKGFLIIAFAAMYLPIRIGVCLAFQKGGYFCSLSS